MAILLALLRSNTDKKIELAAITVAEENIITNAKSEG
jgi:hypothetical protein